MLQMSAESLACGICLIHAHVMSVIPGLGPGPLHWSNPRWLQKGAVAWHPQCIATCSSLLRRAGLRCKTICDVPWLWKAYAAMAERAGMPLEAAVQFLDSKAWLGRVHLIASPCFWIVCSTSYCCEPLTLLGGAEVRWYFQAGRRGFAPWRKGLWQSFGRMSCLAWYCWLMLYVSSYVINVYNCLTSSQHQSDFVRTMWSLH